MSRPRLSGDKYTIQRASLEHRNGRLEGESDGRTWGRFEERTLIVKWLKGRPERIARQMAILIRNGIHAKEE
jgi:hypothetical protein